VAECARESGRRCRSDQSHVRPPRPALFRRDPAGPIGFMSLVKICLFRCCFDSSRGRPRIRLSRDALRHGSSPSHQVARLALRSLDISSRNVDATSRVWTCSCFSSPGSGEYRIGSHIRDRYPSFGIDSRCSVCPTNSADSCVALVPRTAKPWPRQAASPGPVEPNRVGRGRVVPPRGDKRTAFSRRKMRLNREELPGRANLVGGWSPPHDQSIG
jgi:hypothetical protein